MYLCDCVTVSGWVWTLLFSTSCAPWDSIRQVLLPMQRQICWHDTLWMHYKHFLSLLNCVSLYKGKKSKSFILAHPSTQAIFKAVKSTAPLFELCVPVARAWAYTRKCTHTICPVSERFWSPIAWGSAITVGTDSYWVRRRRDKEKTSNM